MYPRYSSHTLSTSHASRTHVKASQTDFHVKPYNSSGLTYDSPSERPLRTKVTFQPKQAPKSSEESHTHRIVREPTKPSERPTPSLPRAMKEASNQQVRLHGSTQPSSKASKLGLSEWVSVSLFGKKDNIFLSLSMYIFYLIYLYPYLYIYRVVIFAVTRCNFCSGPVAIFAVGHCSFCSG